MQRWVSLQNKMKPKATRNRRCKCSRDMAGKITFLPEEASRTQILKDLLE